jgi:hypothetical protein
LWSVLVANVYRIAAPRIVEPAPVIVVEAPPPRESEPDVDAGALSCVGDAPPAEKELPRFVFVMLLIAWVMIVMVFTVSLLGP